MARSSRAMTRKERPPHPSHEHRPLAPLGRAPVPAPGALDHRRLQPRLDGARRADRARGRHAAHLRAAGARHGARLLRRLGPRHPGPGHSGLDLLRLPAADRHLRQRLHGRNGGARLPPRRLRGGDHPGRPDLRAAGPDARGAGARHGAGAGDPHHRPAPGADPDVAEPGLAARHLDQGQRHRLGRGRAGADAPVADPGRADLPAVRDLHRRDAGLFLPLLPRGARRRRHLPARRPPGGVVTFDWSVVTGNLGLLLQGAEVTVALTCITMALAIPGGLLLATLRLSPFAPVRGLAAAFVEFFRATPLILQLYWMFYVLPAFFDVQLSEWATAIVGLVCNVSSFNAETFRAGIRSIRPGLWHAGLALGMGGPQVFFRIVLPQAAMRVLPALATTWVSLFKDTSLVSVIAVADLSYVALKLRAETYRILEVLTAMAALYWLMGYPQPKLCDWVHRRYRVVE